MPIDVNIKAEVVNHYANATSPVDPINTAAFVDISTDLQGLVYNIVKDAFIENAPKVHVDEQNCLDHDHAAWSHVL